MVIIKTGSTNIIYKVAEMSETTLEAHAAFVRVGEEPLSIADLEHGLLEEMERNADLYFYFLIINSRINSAI